MLKSWTMKEYQTINLLKKLNKIIKSDENSYIKSMLIFTFKRRYDIIFRYVEEKYSII